MRTGRCASSLRSSGWSVLRLAIVLATLELLAASACVRAPRTRRPGRASNAPAPLHALAHDARGLAEVLRLRRHHRLGLAELVDLAVQPVPPVLLQKILGHLCVKTEVRRRRRRRRRAGAGAADLVHDGPAYLVAPVEHAEVAPQARVLGRAVPRLADERHDRRGAGIGLLEDLDEHVARQRVDVVLLGLEVRGVAPLLLHLRAAAHAAERQGAPAGIIAGRASGAIVAQSWDAVC